MKRRTQQKTRTLCICKMFYYRQVLIKPGGKIPVLFTVVVSVEIGGHSITMVINFLGNFPYILPHLLILRWAALMQKGFVTNFCHNDELSLTMSWLFTNRFSATRYKKVERMRITEILGRIWLFSANKIKSSESVI